MVRPSHGPLFGALRPVSYYQPRVPVQFVARRRLAGAAGSLLATFNEDQARGLRRLRSQLSENELMEYSDLLRNEAIIRRAQREFRIRNAAPVREEDEVPDPIPSTINDNVESSRSDTQSSSDHVNRDPPNNDA